VIDPPDPFDGLLGEEAPARPERNRGGRPTNEMLAARRLQEEISLKAAASGRGLSDVGGVQVLRRPVTISTLATIFEHDPQTITKRLVDCPFVGQSGRKLYDFKEACSYIVKPRMTPEQFVKTLNKADLPPEINLAFWNAQRAKLKFKLEAQEAWETEDVLAVLGDVFMTIKDNLTTVVEEMRERAKLTDEQAKQFEEAIDELRDTLRQKLVEMPAEKRTASILEQPLFGAAKEIVPDNFEDWDADA
jgi:hypothetical protein